MNKKITHPKLGLSFIFLANFIFLLSYGVHAQKKDQNRSDYFKQAKIMMDRPGKSPMSIRFDKSRQPSKAAFFNEYRKEYNFPNDNQMKPGKEVKDQVGIHQRFYQYYKGIEVLGAQYILHEKSGSVYFANGELVHIIDFDVQPSLSSEQALQAALNNIGAKSYMWEKQENEEFLKKEQKDRNASFRPIGVLKITSGSNELSPENIRLVYRFDIYAEQPLGRYWVDVDAKTGEVINKLSRIHDAFVTGSGDAIYNGTVPLEIEEDSPGNFRMQGVLETSKYPDVAIKTFNMNNQTSFSLATNITSTAAAGPWDAVAAQAHWGAQQTHDYFYTSFYRNSIDDLGLPLLNYVHYRKNLVNAYWDGSRMLFGDGNGVNYGPLVALDIVGHELTHGVTQYSSDLVYQRESGALNESFSDIFGEVVEYYATGTNDWQMAADIGIGGSGALRSMNDPNIYEDPDTYRGNYWRNADCADPDPYTNDYCGVHTNSGVQNKWFYILSVGESGTNDNGDSYNITGIGMNAAAAIAYRNLTVYLTPNANYKNARLGAINAAIDLYGEASQEVASVKAAWEAVGVYEDPPAKGILVWDGIAGGQDFSGNFINAYLTNLGFTTYHTSDFPLTLVGYDAVFLSFGNYGLNVAFINTTAAIVKEYLLQGGKVYLEGGDALGWDQKSNTALLNLFGLEGATDGVNDSINGLEGQVGTITEGMLFSSSSQVRNNYIDKYTPKDGAVAFIELGYGNVAVQNSGTFGQKTFCFSYALAGLTDSTSPSTKNELLANIINFFDVHPIPVAQNDLFSMTRFQVLSGNLLNDNGNGDDNLGDPSATLVSFGGGSLAGDLNSNVAGSSVPFAGGTLEVKGDGSILLTNPSEIGSFSFWYKISNGTKSAQAEVIITILNIAPKVVCLESITVSADANCQNSSLTAYDLISDLEDPDGDPLTVNLSPAGPYPLGTTNVELKVSDAYEESTCMVTVTVIDDVKPTINCPADVTNAKTSDDGSGDCTTTVELGDPEIDDNCSVASVVAQVDGLDIDPATFLFGIGDTTVTWIVTDGSGNTASCDQTVTVADDETTITSHMINSNVVTADKSISIVYGCITPEFSITATGLGVLTYKWFVNNSDSSSGGTQVSIDPNSASYIVPEATNVGTYYYYAEVTSDCNTVKSDVFALTIMPQPADLDADSYYTGPNVAWTATSTSNTATVTLSAFLKNSELPGSECGDISTARVSFYVNGNIVPGAKDLPVNYVDSSNPSKGGTAAAIVQLNISNNVSSEIFDIKVAISGNYKAADAGGQISQILIGKLIPGGAIGGGTKLSNANSNGFVKGANAKLTTATFGVEYKKKGKSFSSPSGRVTLYIPSYNDRYGNPTSEIHWYFVKSNAIASLAINSPEATFTSKSNIAEYDPITETLSSIEGNCTMVIDMGDYSGSCPNYLDKVGVTVYRNSGGIWYSNNWVKTKTVFTNIEGGDIAVTGITSASSIATVTSYEKGDILDKEQSMDEFQLVSWPNPSETEFYLKVNSGNRNDKVEIRVFDINGRQVYHKLGDANKEYHFGSNLESGMYIAKVIQGDKSVQVRMIKY